MKGKNNESIPSLIAGMDTPERRCLCISYVLQVN